MRNMNTIRHTLQTIFLLLVIFCPHLWGQKYNALRFNRPEAYNAYLMRYLHRKNLERDSIFNSALTSKDALKRHIEFLKQQFNTLYGTFPERLPIKSKVVGRILGEGFIVEKIWYQSLPGRYVTAHLYLPKSTSKQFPACIEMCGHGLRGKGSGSNSAILMALNGIATLVVDPIGQGERLQLIDVKSFEPLTRGATTEHTLLNPGLMLLGSSLAAQEYWDNSRAIDYLLSRKDIDGTRIGAYGFSGGGTQSTYLIAMDNRIQAACIGLFFSNRTRTLELMGPSDGCQQIQNEGALGIELADFALTMAPKPLLILDGLYDFVDHWGALQGFKELKQAYKLLGYPENISQYYAEDGHSTPPDVQEQLVRWFSKWLTEYEPVTVNWPQNPHWQGSNMLCTTLGQVNVSFHDSKSLIQEYLEKMNSLEVSRNSFCQSDKQKIKSMIMKLLGIQNLSNEVEAVCTGFNKLKAHDEYRFQLNSKGQMPIACIVRIPHRPNANAPIKIHLCDKGKSWFMTDLDRKDETSDGTILIAADFRGLGEMEDPSIYNLSKYWNREWRNAAISIHIGRPIMGQRVTDLYTLVNFCSSNELLKGHPVQIIADGIYGPVVMHGVVLDERIKHATLSRTLKTWREYLTKPQQYDMYSNVIPNVLHYYDLPNLIKLSESRIKFTD